jgi:ATP-dependent Clp protease ATP-binding subunit ClpC
VGKTHLAKALAEVLFGSERALIRFDMSEFQEPHSISKLIGAPPGYVGYEQGGRLTEAVRRQPFSVVLLDEIEKAHPDIYNTFLQVLDEGRLTDGLGRTVDFRRVILIMTSNTGYNVGPAIGFTNREVDTESPLKAIFTPEFLDRLDEVIRFRNLSESELTQVAQIMLEDIAKELESREKTVRFDPSLASWLVEQAPKQGSTRILRNLIREKIEDPLSLELLSRPGRPLFVTLKNGQIAFEEKELSLGLV